MRSAIGAVLLLLIAGFITSMVPRDDLERRKISGEELSW
jgi:hypothetical protein